MRRAKKQKQEGAALLIVLFVLLMATGTAAFTLQNTQYEIRAAGSLHQAIRTRYIAEAATVTLQSSCAHGGVDQCLGSRGSGGDIQADWRTMYTLPNWGGEIVFPFDEKRFASTDAAEWPAPALPTDSVISGGGTAAPYTPSVNAMVEVWDRPGVGGNTDPTQHPRLIVSVYGALSYDPDSDLSTVNDVVGTGELRQSHQSISATRAFIDF